MICRALRTHSYTQLTKIKIPFYYMNEHQHGEKHKTHMDTDAALFNDDVLRSGLCSVAIHGPAGCVSNAYGACACRRRRRTCRRRPSRICMRAGSRLRRWCECLRLDDERMLPNACDDDIVGCVCSCVLVCDCKAPVCVCVCMRVYACVCL